MSDRNAAALPTVLVPGLTNSPRLYAEQIPALWRFGPVMVADHTRHDSMAAIAGSILAAAPPRFALAGLSMGGYISFEIMRQAPQRVAKLALLDTAARPGTPEQAERRLQLMAMAETGRYGEAVDSLFPTFVHRNRRGDAVLRNVVRAMADDTGPQAFIREQQAIMDRPDSRPGLAAIACSTVVVVGDGDELTPPELSQEIAGGIKGARLVVIPDSGHLSTLERPEAVTAALVEWLDN